MPRGTLRTDEEQMFLKPYLERWQGHKKGGKQRTLLVKECLVAFFEQFKYTGTADEVKTAENSVCNWFRTNRDTLELPFEKAAAKRERAAKRDAVEDGPVEEPTLKVKHYSTLVKPAVKAKIAERDAVAARRKEEDAAEAARRQVVEDAGEKYVAPPPEPALLCDIVITRNEVRRVWLEHKEGNTETYQQIRSFVDKANGAGNDDNSLSVLLRSGQLTTTLRPFMVKLEKMGIVGVFHLCAVNPKDDQDLQLTACYPTSVGRLGVGVYMPEGVMRSFEKGVFDFAAVKLGVKLPANGDLPANADAGEQNDPSEESQGKRKRALSLSGSESVSASRKRVKSAEFIGIDSDDENDNPEENEGEADCPSNSHDGTFTELELGELLGMEAIEELLLTPVDVVEAIQMVAERDAMTDESDIPMFDAFIDFLGPLADPGLPIQASSSTILPPNRQIFSTSTDPPVSLSTPVTLSVTASVPSKPISPEKTVVADKDPGSNAERVLPYAVIGQSPAGTVATGVPASSSENGLVYASELMTTLPDALASKVKSAPDFQVDLESLVQDDSGRRLQAHERLLRAYLALEVNILSLPGRWPNVTVVKTPKPDAYLQWVRSYRAKKLLAANKAAASHADTLPDQLFNYWRALQPKRNPSNASSPSDTVIEIVDLLPADIDNIPEWFKIGGSNGIFCVVQSLQLWKHALSAEDWKDSMAIKRWLAVAEDMASVFSVLSSSFL